MFVELSKESCKAIHAEMEAEWVATQEEKIPGSTRIKYGEYACKAWQAAEKADEDMHRRRALGEKVTWKAKYTRYRSNLSGYFETHIDKLFGSNFVLDYLICFGVCTPGMIAAKNIVDENRRKLQAETGTTKLPPNAHLKTTKVSARRLAQYLGENPPPVMGEQSKPMTQSALALSSARLYDKKRRN